MIKHPAKYSDAILPILARASQGCKLVLDPFAGTGKLRQIRPDAVLLEIEPEWAAISKAIVGNALQMPFQDETFDGIITSPVYGNRCSDRFDDKQPEKHYVRHTYTHALGRKLHPDNSGQLQWGKKYKIFHIKAWKECRRVLKPNGLLILNISDHIRNKKVQPVTKWHIMALTALGFKMENIEAVKTPRNRMGTNNRLRVDHEFVITFRKI